MEEYREKLKINITVTAIACIILAAFSILTYDSDVGIVPGIGQHGWRSFVSGAASGIVIAFLIDLVRSILALRDEKKLKKMYIRKTDERHTQIWNYAMASASQAVLRIQIAAIFVASYFNMTVGITILFCAMLHSLLILTSKFYYSRKF